MRIVNDGDTPQRADVLLANSYPQYSRAALAKLFVMGNIVQDTKILRAGDKLQPGKFFDADVEPIEFVAEEIDIPVIFEDENIIVVDKPVGVISHARGKYWDEASVASFIRSRTQGMDGERAGIVHRLDRATSGVMICGKNAATMSMLQKQFAQRKTKKSYMAVVSGRPHPDAAIIDVPIARNPKKPQTFQPDPKGKASQSQYEVIQSNQQYALVKLTPATGRTHQLRVHLAYIKHPIVGDELYGELPGDRLFLHATSLEITIPGGERRVFESNLPVEFLNMVK